MAPWIVPSFAGNLPLLCTYFGTDKWGVHWYAQHYQRHFAEIRTRPVRVLEIGVGGYDDPSCGAASLRVWKYYFSKGQIFGIDIEDKRAFEESRIRIFQGDQCDADFLREVVAAMGGVDVVIDDGSHINEHVRTTWAVLFPLLADDGLYAIEDLHTSYVARFGGGVHRTDTSMDLVLELARRVNYEEFTSPDEVRESDKSVVAVHVYHNLVVIQKGANTEGCRRSRIDPEWQGETMRAAGCCDRLYGSGGDL